MYFRSLFAWMVLGLVVSACVSESVQEVTAPPSTVTSTPVPISRPIDFITPDGVTLGGRLYGSGKTAVIFSVMGNCRREWEPLAALVAQHNMTALTYAWRGCKESGTVVESENRRFVDDLRGAIAFVRSQGAERIVLVGASLGGVASARLAVESRASGLVILAAPSEIPEWGFRVEAADLNTSAPKLFITSEEDGVVSPSRTRALFELAAEPKDWQTYPGTAHGTDMFKTPSGPDAQQRILSFIVTIGSSTYP